jgi:hypothetical protein
MAPYRRRLPRVGDAWLCVGCGKRYARRPHSYCRLCRRRVADGIPVDVDDVPTQDECYAVNRRMAVFFKLIPACKTV